MKNPKTITISLLKKIESLSGQEMWATYRNETIGLEQGSKTAKMLRESYQRNGRSSHKRTLLSIFPNTGPQIYPENFFHIV